MKENILIRDPKTVSFNFDYILMYYLQNIYVKYM